MKKKLVLLSLILGLTVQQALANTQAALVIAGYVDEICELIIDPLLPQAVDLNLAGGTAAIADFQVGTYTINHNFAGGFSLAISSVNAGALVRHDGPFATAYESPVVNSVAYTLDFEGITCSTGANTAVAPTAVSTVFCSSTTGGTTSLTGNVEINYTQNDALPSGAYSDKVTVVLAAL